MSSASLSSIASNSTSNSGIIANSGNNQTDANDANNPFDITENKDYFKSQDVEMKQLIINVIFQKKLTYDKLIVFLTCKII